MSERVTRCCRYFSLIALSLFLLVSIPWTVRGEEETIGRIDKVSGDVIVERGAEGQIAARQGLALFPGDEISTGRDGIIWFSLQQGRQFRLGRDSRMSLDELSSPEIEDGFPAIRLFMGYLWSKLEKIGQKLRRVEICTPTVVIGVRGTEFDTAVSLDAGSMVVVDEGVVEVEAEEETLLVDRDKLVQVEIGKRPEKPRAAIPRDKRDWQEWRKQRAKRLIRNMPMVVPKIRLRFDRALLRSQDFTGRVNHKAGEIQNLVQEVRRAMERRDRPAFLSARGELVAQMPEFKRMKDQFRRGSNRVRTLGKLSRQLEKLSARHHDRYSSDELEIIEGNLKSVSRKRSKLREIFQQTAGNIRHTFRELRDLKEDIMKRRKGRSS